MDNTANNATRLAMGTAGAVLGRKATREMKENWVRYNLSTGEGVAGEGVDRLTYAADWSGPVMTRLQSALRYLGIATIGDLDHARCECCGRFARVTERPYYNPTSLENGSLECLDCVPEHDRSNDRGP